MKTHEHLQSHATSRCSVPTVGQPRSPQQIKFSILPMATPMEAGDLKPEAGNKSRKKRRLCDLQMLGPFDGFC